MSSKMSQFDDEAIDSMFDECRMMIKEYLALGKIDILPNVSVSQKLQSYAYYKQATKGPCVRPEPEWWKATEKYKWSEWKKLGNKSQRECKIAYIKLAVEVLSPLLSIDLKTIEGHFKLITDWKVQETHRNNFKRITLRIKDL